MEVFDISELRKEILSHASGATCWPLRGLSRAFKDTIDELLAVKTPPGVIPKRHLICGHDRAVKVGCWPCLRYMITRQGVNLSKLVIDLIDADYYGLALCLIPRLEFETPAKARYYWNSINTLLYLSPSCESVDQLKEVVRIKKHKSKLTLIPEFTHNYTLVKLMELIADKMLPISAVVCWIQRSPLVTSEDQIQLANILINNFDLITEGGIDVYNNTIVALFNRDKCATAYTLLTTVGSYYYYRHVNVIVEAAIGAKSCTFELFMEICKRLRGYTMTQERLQMYINKAIESGKYDICVELKKVAIVAGYSYTSNFSQYPSLSTLEQIKCMNVFYESETCANVLNGVITATEYTAECLLTAHALIAGLKYDSTQFYRRATYLSIIYSGALDYLNKYNTWKFYYILILSPDIVVNIINNNTTDMDCVAMGLYNTYLEYGPIPRVDFYPTLLQNQQHNTTFSKLLLSFLSNVVADVSDGDIRLLTNHEHRLILTAATHLKIKWWYERLYRLRAVSWEDLRQTQLKSCCCLFYIPDDLGKRKHVSEKNKGRKRRKLN
jgi:hypothetical protein